MSPPPAAMFFILLVLLMATTALGQDRKIVLINPTQRSISIGRDASRAIDGDEQTEYYSLTSTEEWIKLDLQDPSIISTVTMIGR